LKKGALKTGLGAQVGMHAFLAFCQDSFYEKIASVDLAVVFSHLNMVFVRWIVQLEIDQMVHFWWVLAATVRGDDIVSLLFADGLDFC